MDVVEATGAVLQAVYPIGRPDDQTQWGYPEKKVILRFHAATGQDVVAALDAAGFPVIESTGMQSPDCPQLPADSAGNADKRRRG